MSEGKRVRRWLLGIATLALVGALPAMATAQAEHVRWDVVIVSPPSVLPGGTATAQAEDGSTIKMTGSGTFVAPSPNGGSPGSDSSTSGGGTWTTFDASGAQTGTGTYEVTGLVRWEREPGHVLPGILTNDTIDDGEPSSGLAVLRILYSDGKRGVLIVSCNLPAPAPRPDMFEGITATRRVVDYWKHVSGTTLFHVRQ